MDVTSPTETNTKFTSTWEDQQDQASCTNVCYHRAIVPTLLELPHHLSLRQFVKKHKLGSTNCTIKVEFAMQKWSENDIIAVILLN